jgi:ureidoglycolate lyase
MPPVLKAEPLEPDEFAAYGDVVGATSQNPGQHINDGTTLKLAAEPPSLNDQSGRPALYVYRASAQQLPLMLQALERHALGSQTFIPLCRTPFVVVVAQSTACGNEPELSSLRAFWADGTQAVTIRAGTWHHGLIAMTDGDFVVLERHSTVPDCDLFALPQTIELRAGAL